MNREIDINKIQTISRNSVDLIRSLDLKNRKKHKFVPTKVIDNFFESPSLWRKLALSQEFSLATDAAYPGKRSNYINNIDKESFELLAISLLKHLPMFNGFSSLWATFHLTNETYGNGWVHDDDPTLSVSGLIYLNPNPPANSGTTIYKDKFDYNADEYSDMYRQDVLYATAEERASMRKYRDAQRGAFTPSMNIENVYNRCVFFDPKVWHAPNNFFGKTDDESRLTLVFFAKGG
tara:strand:- start:9573 stop:10277 length:705 start_codon:yes stop_codon:yes gene_type:complete